MTSKRIIAQTTLLLFVNFIICSYCPITAHAQESLNITGLAINAPAFKPYREQGEFSFFLSRNASVNIELQDRDFNLVRSIALMAEKKEGENLIAWDGKDEQGRFVKSGEYIFSVTAMAEDGSSVNISKDVTIEFVAPMGTEFKAHLSMVEGKTKKQHISTNDASRELKVGESCLPAIGSCILGPALLALVPALYNAGKEQDERAPKDTQKERDDAKYTGEVYSFFPCIFGATLTYVGFNYAKTGIEDITSENTEWSAHVFYYKPDYKKLARMNREIDEYNAGIDAEIAQRNREIDAHNERVRESVIIKIRLTE
ncbi:MAG: hypothetical protein HZA78_03850 [Candidatus Schekmanbacteria bacterium]|nr:hypothetical protein [Candidatus Schekmanbacteria bacterium]